MNSSRQELEDLLKVDLDSEDSVDLVVLKGFIKAEQEEQVDNNPSEMYLKNLRNFSQEVQEEQRGLHKLQQKEKILW